jgi:hypothetical protein
MQLDPVFEHEFGACVPDPRHTCIIAETEDSQIKGFVTVESVPVVGMLYTFPRYRKELRIPYRLLDAVEEASEKARRSLYAMTAIPSVERFLARRGAKEVPMKLFRKDYEVSHG